MNSKALYASLVAVQLILVWWSKDFILFWDTVQFTGKHGLWYYEHGLGSGLLPAQLDSGHPPFFGWYQALVWKVFGKSLAVSSFSMLPFLLLNIVMAGKLGQLLLPQRWWLVPIALLICPFYLGHSILISPDIVLVAGFLLTLYGILAYKRRYILGGSILLSLISTRGNAVLLVLMLFQFWELVSKGEQKSVATRKLFRLYLVPVLLILAYQLVHYFQSQWIGFHEDSPWSSSFELVSLSGLGKNIVVFIWRLCDYGLFLAHFIIFYFAVFKRNRPPLFYLWLGLLLLFMLLILPFNGLLNHRYFLPVQLTTLILAFWYLRTYKLYMSGIVMAVIALGNLIVYPTELAQGWDSTAAHWPFYKLEKDMHRYILEETDMKPEDIGTAFPLRVDRKYLDLHSTGSYHSYDLSQDKWILYSTVMNEFSDTELEALKHWTVLKEIERRNIKVQLLRSPE